MGVRDFLVREEEGGAGLGDGGRNVIFSLLTPIYTHNTYYTTHPSIVNVLPIGPKLPIPSH